MIRRLVATAAMAVAAIAVTLTTGAGPALAAEKTRSHSLRTDYGLITLRVSHDGSLQTNLEVRSDDNPIKSESYVEILYRDSDVANVKFPQLSRDNGAYVYTNPINRPSVVAVQFHIFIGPDGREDDAHWEYRL